jgi:hypothetical protein
VNFDRDTTTRWASRGGDCLLWGRLRGLFSPLDRAYSLADIWELHDGDFVTLTGMHLCTANRSPSQQAARRSEM